MKFGDPQRFAFVFPDSTGTPDEGSVWIDGRSVTAHVCEMEVVTRVAAPWLALGRWFIEAWPAFFETPRWPLASRAPNALRFWRELQARTGSTQHPEARATLEETAGAFRQGHQLGGSSWPDALPQVFLSRDGDDIVVAWQGPRAAGASRRFLAEEGEARVPAVELARTVEAYVDWTGGQPGGPSSVAVATWRANLPSPAAARTAVRHQAGLSTATLDTLLVRAGDDFETFFAIRPEDLRDGALISAYASPVALAFRSTAPQLDPSSLLALRALIVGEGPNPRGQRIIEAVRDRLPRPAADLLDYQQGYEYASTVRRWLGNRDQPLDIEALLTQTLSIPLREVALSDGDTDGGCVWGDESGPMVFVNTEALMARTPWGRRMTLAHELCHLLLDRPPRRALSHVSGRWSIPALERRANAFAAELLLPQGALEAARDRGEGYGELMASFGVGLTTATWQVRNRLDGELPGAEQVEVGGSPRPRTGGVMTAEQYQVLFALLAEPGLLAMSSGFIAQRAAASIADVEAVFARLAQRGNLVSREVRRHLIRPGELARWWLTGYGDVVRPTALIRDQTVSLPGSRDAALGALAARLDAGPADWLWTGEPAAWIWRRSLAPEHLVVLVDGSPPPDLDGPGESTFEVSVLRLFCPAARGDEEARTAHPLLVWSELMLRPSDPRVRELADEIAAEMLEPPHPGPVRGVTELPWFVRGFDSSL